MTEQEIDSMPMGKEMERLIAEKIMEHRPIPDEHKPWVQMAARMFAGPHSEDQFETAVVVPHDDGTWHHEQPRWFSTDIHAIWPLVEKMKPLRLWLIDLGDYWQASFLDETGEGVKANGETPMLAICRAAMKVKLMGVKQ